MLACLQVRNIMLTSDSLNERTCIVSQFVSSFIIFLGLQFLDCDDLIIASTCFCRLSFPCLISSISALILFILYSLPSLSLKVGFNCDLRIVDFLVTLVETVEFGANDTFQPPHFVLSCSRRSITSITKATSATAAKFTSHQRSCGCKCTLNGNWEAGGERVFNRFTN